MTFMTESLINPAWLLYLQTIKHQEISYTIVQEASLPVSKEHQNKGHPRMNAIVNS